MTNSSLFSQKMRPGFGKARILIVDSDEIYACSIISQLNSAGHSVTRASTREEAAIFGKVEWDLIVTDWNLPGLGGKALLDSLRPSDRPVIVWSDSPDASPLAASCGVKSFHRRSQRNNLEKEIRNHLNNRNETELSSDNIPIPPIIENPGDN